MVSEGMDRSRAIERERSDEQLGGTRREKRRGEVTRGWRRVRAACIFLRLSS